MSTARVELPPKLHWVFAGKARYRGAYGGRGSAKTRSFAKMAAIRGYQLSQEGKSGVIVCGREFMNSLDESSLAEVKAAIASEPWMAPYYDVGEKYVRTIDGRISFAFIGLRHNLDSIKSKSQIHILWVDEAEPVSESAWIKITPTVREHDSEIWVTWNPERENSATHKRFRIDPPKGARIVEINYIDNPFFPAVLEKERLDDLEKRPDQYAHIWEGAFVTVVEGAYYAKSLIDARKEKRIGKVAADPLMQIKAFWDIGVRDATAIWIAQFVGREIRVLNYYEAVGQPLSAHLEWLRSSGYGQALCVLPHDGAHHDQVTATRFEDHIRSAGFQIKTIGNQGKGAALKRIEAGRRLFPSIWFNQPTCEPGLKALGWYHERRDDERNIGLGPEHDWSSHCFVGETLVQTQKGLVRFDQLPQTGLVSTPCGYKPYRSPRMTRANAPLVEVAFSDGHTVKCTPDHLFATGEGWKSAQSLKTDLLILSTSTTLRSILTAGCIGLGLTKNTLAGAARDYIARFGLALSGKYRRVATSTIATETRSTTYSTTWNAWTRVSTLASHGTAAHDQPKPSIFQPWRGIVPETGIHPKTGFSGTNDTLCGRSFGPKTREPNGPAPIAALSLWGWIGLLRRLRSSVRQLASGKTTGNPVVRTHMPLRIVSVKPAGRADVWDITVPDIECFSLANGVVVHNCADAFGLMCVAYEEPRTTDKGWKFQPRKVA